MVRCLVAGSLGAGTIVGSGSGTCLDAARAAAAATRLPFVSCPTEASTDARTSVLSVVSTAAGVAEAYRIGGSNSPCAVAVAENRS